MVAAHMQLPASLSPASCCSPCFLTELRPDCLDDDCAGQCHFCMGMYHCVFPWWACRQPTDCHELMQFSMIWLRWYSLFDIDVVGNCLSCLPSVLVLLPRDSCWRLGDLFCQSRSPRTGFMHSSVCQLFRWREFLPRKASLSTGRCVSTERGLVH